ncbi:MAG: 8-amino-7-oxononanoate synthase, partial [Candidatus Rokubacteria bacterium]|nr:8-amino-7-oxononanoate synthase [Candidatus Rokubacteria bacterium]
MLSEFIRSELEELRRASLLREPRVIDRIRGPYVTIGGRELLCFCSNDYLGIGQDPRLGEAAARAARDFGWGAVSSRALSGTTRWHAALEEAIAEFKGAPAALHFPSGYAANLGLIASIADRDTLIVSDELNHASLIDGCRLSRAKIEVYPHRDVEAAARLLKVDAKRKFILTDTVFSMDGDLAPLDALRALGSDVVIDDVHGLGVFGAEGRGNLEVPVQTGNLAKAAGGAGGFVVGSRELIELLRSRARAFLFTTAPPPALCAAAVEALRLVRSAEDRRAKLWAHIRLMGASSPIHTVILGSNERALEASRRLFELGFFVPAIRPPSVALGTARLRITLTAM